MHPHEPLAEARAAMKAHRYPEAIGRLEAWLEEHPDDLGALLHLGICHLLDRSEARFLELFEQAKALRARLPEVSEDVLRTFEQVQRLATRVAATTLVVATTATMVQGCNACSGHKYSGGVDLGFVVQDSGVQDSRADTAGDTGALAPSEDTATP